MNFKLVLSKSASKAVNRSVITRDDLITIIKDTIKVFQGEDIPIDIKKMSGKWKEHYRIKNGDIRIIFSFDFTSKTIRVKKIGNRGDIYK
ncbi:MAG: type II toxin-antitoxin system RelE family toxin [Candidatus Zixiibacteriota bacterium]